MGRNMITTEQQAEMQAEFEAAYAAWFGKEIEPSVEEFDEVLDDGDIALLTELMPAWA